MTEIEKRPSAVEFDEMKSMCSTPLICCSSGATTVEATTSALAPGYCPVTLTTGGAISGYWAIGRRRTATTPRMMNTTEMTLAKIGRSMKKCEIRIAGCPQLTRIVAVEGAPPASTVTCCGVTLAPGRTRIRPLTMTVSLASSPFTTRRPSTS